MRQWMYGAGSRRDRRAAPANLQRSLRSCNANERSMPGRILICEDEERIARFVARALAAEGLEVDVAVDGETALARAEAAPPDLVVLDLRLPGIGGLEVLGRLRDRDPSVVVVVLSALGDVATKVAALAGGASDYVV